MKNTGLLIAVIFLLSFTTVKSQNKKVEIKTEIGSIITELYPEKAPVTCENFLKYIENKNYDNASFYRVVNMNNQPNNEIKIEVIQGGLGFNSEATSFLPIIHETTKETGLSHKDGTLSMARLEPGTASSEFFICIGNQPELDFGGRRNKDGQGFAAFGQVIEGMEIVRKIQQLQDKNQMLIDQVKIHSITILN